MSISEVENKKTWEDFVQRFSPNNFLTSWEWGEFNKRMRRDIFRLGFWEGSKLTGVCLTIHETAKRGGFILCPAGPLLDKFSSRNFKFIVSQLRQIAKEVDAKFIRIRPLYTIGQVE